MCIIIQKPAGKTLPYEKFKNCVINNPDGYGWAIPDGNNSLEVFRSSEKPDVDVLYETINEDFKDEEVMLHLRYTTAGATILRNAHPFPILEKSKDGIDLRMCHNGTLGLYTPKKGESSDTRQFVKLMVRPLFKRLAKSCDGDFKAMLEDPWVSWLLNGELTAKSVITFIDGQGNTLRLNEAGNGGKVIEDVYYSNVYSFDPNHRIPLSYTRYSTGTTYSSPKPTEKVELAMDTQTEKFTTKYDVTLTELKVISDDFIAQLIEEKPEDAELLLKELLSEVA